MTISAVLTLYSILKAKEINVKYITSKDGFRLGQLVELRDFLEQWKKSSYVEAEAWIKLHYSSSANYPLAQKVIEQFINENNTESLVPEYLAAAFEEYLYDIEFDEFEFTKAKVIVSTMHKAKGKEFDSVYVMVENNFIQDDYQRRLLYVAITRAKENLYIHTQDQCFKPMESLANEVVSVTQTGSEPDSIIFTMGLGDIWLKNYEAVIGISRTEPKAGDTVQIRKTLKNDSNLRFEIIKNGYIIGVLSKPENKNRLSDKILQKESEGYKLNPDVIIEYIVRWKEAMGEERYDEVLCKVSMQK